MGTRFEELQNNHVRFVEAQPIFFVATAPPPGGHINLSPKGMDSLRVLAPNRIIWRNFTGSGNETAPHLAADPRMTLMWCAFARRPMTLRAYGTARAIHRGDADWAALDAHFDPDFAARQVFDLDIELVQQSCGYSIPLMTLESERDTLRNWATDRGPEGVETYWAERNAATIDSVPTNIATLNRKQDPS